MLSEVVAFIHAEALPGSPSVWSRVISPPSSGELRLKESCPAVDISDAEEAVLHEIFDEYGSVERPELIARLQEQLPELPVTEDVAPIHTRDVLLHGGYTEAEAPSRSWMDPQPLHVPERWAAVENPYLRVRCRC